MPKAGEYLNPVAERYTGWLTQDARGKPLEEIYRVIDERTGRAVEPFAVDAAVRARTGCGIGAVGGSQTAAKCPNTLFSGGDTRRAMAGCWAMIVVFHDISQDPGHVAAADLACDP